MHLEWYKHLAHDSNAPCACVACQWSRHSAPHVPTHAHTKWGGHWEYPEDNHGNLIGTTDGGETWNLLAEGTGPGYRSSIVHHPIRKQEIACTGFRGLDISKGGGQTWIHVNDSSRYVARFSPDGRTLWLAGKQTISSVDWDEIATLD